MNDDEKREYARRLLLKQKRETEVKRQAGWSEQMASIPQGQAEHLLDAAVRHSRKIHTKD